MKGWTVKKIILRCFFATGLFYLHEKFQLWQSSPSHFFIKKMAFFIIFVGKIFFLQNIYGFTPVKKILSHLDQKWAQTKQLLSKKFQLPIAMEGCIVQCIVLNSSEYGVMRISWTEAWFIPLLRHFCHRQNVQRFLETLSTCYIILMTNIRHNKIKFVKEKLLPDTGRSFDTCTCGSNFFSPCAWKKMVMVLHVTGWHWY